MSGRRHTEPPRRRAYCSPPAPLRGSTAAGHNWEPSPITFHSPVDFHSPKSCSPSTPPAQPCQKEWKWTTSVAALRNIEYDTFCHAPAQCQLLLRRMLVCAGQAMMDRNTEPPLRLLCVLRAACFLLHECMPETAIAERVLCSAAAAHWFQGVTERLRRSWAVSAPGWLAEDQAAQQRDLTDAVEVLARHLPHSLHGSSDLWPLLDELHGNPAVAPRVASMLVRQHSCIAFADVRPTCEPVERATTVLQRADYRGTVVMLKSVRPRFLSAETMQLTMIRARAWTRVMHPHVVPVVGCAVVQEQQQHVVDCAMLATRFAPGRSLENILYGPQGASLPAALAVLVVRDIVEALVYAQSVEDDREYLMVPELHPSNVLICSDSGRARLLPPLIVKAPPSRWKAPRRAEDPEVYAAGMLLWAALTAGTPLPDVKDEAIPQALKAGTWRPTPTSGVPPSVARVLLRSNGSVQGYVGLGPMLKDLGAVLDEMHVTRDSLRLVAKADSPADTLASAAAVAREALASSGKMLPAPPVAEASESAGTTAPVSVPATDPDAAGLPQRSLTR
eukprot:TRINITY_DN39304_c0_g1_i1.p1 TRINITY_DN39304_c0_g1~~TRINITY_DN39304_c0_g1_i1.p1  ORF type:complete len:561 (+),score=151.87 TRINITY_DN39304_c0_g1_i1:58-1740(+)